MDQKLNFACYSVGTLMKNETALEIAGEQNSSCTAGGWPSSLLPRFRLVVRKSSAKEIVI